MKNYSDYIVYVDESGDHSLQAIYPDYQVFVLAFCIFHKRHYVHQIVPAVQEFKFKYFGHDVVILHEHEIRKEKGVFRFPNREEKNNFLDELTHIIDKKQFILISCVIEKSQLKSRYDKPDNPYHIALKFCLERLYRLMEEKHQENKRTFVVVENRGKKEDNELELEFRRICDGENFLKHTLPFELKFADKKTNSIGLQLADLVARPIGIHTLKPQQENRAFEVLKTKFYCKNGRTNLGENYEGYGLKRFP